MKLTHLLATGMLLLGCSGSAAQPATVTFAVEPSIVGSCSPPVVAKVTWNAAGAGVRSVKIFVHENDGPEKLFAEGATEGSVNTGPWVRPNVVFRLTDGDSGRQLATLTVEGKNC